MPTVGGSFLSPDINGIFLVGSLTVPATGALTVKIGHVPIGSILIDASLAQRVVGAGTTGGTVTLRAEESTPLASVVLPTLQTFSRQVPNAAAEFFITTEDTDITLVVVAGAATWTTLPIIHYKAIIMFPGVRTTV